MQYHKLTIGDAAASAELPPKGMAPKTPPELHKDAPGLPTPATHSTRTYETETARDDQRGIAESTAEEHADDEDGELKREDISKLGPSLPPLGPSQDADAPFASPGSRLTIHGSPSSSLKTAEKFKLDEKVDLVSIRDKFEEILDLGKDKVSSMPDEIVRKTLVKAVDCVKEFNEAATRLKSLATHYQLQNKLLTIETHEAAQRHEVETSIAKREVDRLRIETLEAHENMSDVEVYRRRLRKAKLKLKDAADEIAEKDNEIDRLRRRLREYRLEREARERHDFSQQTSGNREFSTPGQRGSEGDNLAALEMLASQVLSQQIPRSSSPEKPQRFSSIASSPGRYQGPNSIRGDTNNGLMSPVYFKDTPGNAQPASASGLAQSAATEKRRRNSSASTISIPSDQNDTDIEDSRDGDPNATLEEDNVDDDSLSSPLQYKTSPGSPKKYIRKDGSSPERSIPAPAQPEFTSPRKK